MSINQPHYLPSRRYFDRIARSDVHVVLDHVQFEKGSLVNRNRVMLPDGRVTWLTVPVEKGRPINETRIVGDAWQRKHKETLRQVGVNVWPPFWWLFSPQEWLVDLLDVSLGWLSAEAGVPMLDCVWSSDIGGSWLGHKSELVLNICKELGADTYLSGPFGRDYLDLPAFEQAGISVEWHEWDPGPGPELSVVHELAGRVRA